MVSIDEHQSATALLSSIIDQAMAAHNVAGRWPPLNRDMVCINFFRNGKTT